MKINTYKKTESTQMKKILTITRTLLKLFAQRLGVVVYRYKDDFHYVPSIYGSKYEKLIKIQEIDHFQEIAEGVIRDGNTYLGYERLYTLWQAVSQAPDAAIAELGVYKGGSAKFLASARNHFSQTSSPIHLFDTFSHFPDVIEEFDVTDRSGPLPITFEKVTQYLSNEENIFIHKGVFPETAKGLENQEFGIVHLDSDTYSSYKEALIFFSSRLAKGGIIILDDYGFTTCPGAKKATDEFLQQDAQKNKWFFLHLLTGQAVLIQRNWPSD